jgi:hypothetical protein
VRKLLGHAEALSYMGGKHGWRTRMANPSSVRKVFDFGWRSVSTLR